MHTRNLPVMPTCQLRYQKLCNQQLPKAENIQVEWGNCSNIEVIVWVVPLKTSQEKASPAVLPFPLPVSLIPATRQNRKKFECVRRSPWETSEHTKNFFLAKCFIIFFSTFMKNTFSIISRFFTIICWYYLAIWFFTLIHFELSITKDFFLMQIKKDIF